MTQHVTLEYADSIAVIQRRMIWAQTMYMHIESHLFYTLVSRALSEGIPGVFKASNSIPSIANENPAAGNLATTGVGDVQAAEKLHLKISFPRFINFAGRANENICT